MSVTGVNMLCKYMSFSSSDHKESVGKIQTRPVAIVLLFKISFNVCTITSHSGLLDSPPTILRRFYGTDYLNSVLMLLRSEGLIVTSD